MKKILKYLVIIISLLVILYFLYKLIDYIFSEIENYTMDEVEPYNFVIEILIPLLITIIGTFIGFLLAILGQLIYDKIILKKEVKEIQIALKKEIEINNDNQLSETCLYQQFYDTSTFDSIINSGKINKIINTSWYFKIKDIYNKYKEVNYFCQLNITLLEKGRDNTNLINELVNKIATLKHLSEEILKKI